MRTCAPFVSLLLCLACSAEGHVCALLYWFLLLQTLLLPDGEEMHDAKEDGTPMALAHYNVGNGSSIILKITVGAAAAAPTQMAGVHVSVKAMAC